MSVSKIISCSSPVKSRSVFLHTTKMHYHILLDFILCSSCVFMCWSPFLIAQKREACWTSVAPTAYCDDCVGSVLNKTCQFDLLCLPFLDWLLKLSRFFDFSKTYCVSLNVVGPHYPKGVALLGGMTLLKKVCQCGGRIRFSYALTTPSVLLLAR